MDIEQNNNSMSNSGHSNGSQKNINQSNPFFKLQHQNSFPQYQPMYYPPPMGYYPPPPNFGLQNQQQHPQNQQQPQGMFGNFIMNQLSQHMQGGSNKNIQGQGYR